MHAGENTDVYTCSLHLAVTMAEGKLSDCHSSGGSEDKATEPGSQVFVCIAVPFTIAVCFFLNLIP